MLRVGLDSRHKIDRLLAKYVDLIDIPDDIVNVQSELKQAQTNLRQVRQDAASHRKTMLADRVALATVAQNPTAKTGAERIAKAEAMKELHSKLRFISQDGGRENGITRLEVPREPTQDPKSCTE